MNRYDGKPLLRLLELYVVWCAGQLGAKDRDVLERMTPKLRETYSQQGSWYEIIEAVMELPIEGRQKIAAKWNQQHHGMSAQAFAEHFVDQNLT